VGGVAKFGGGSALTFPRLVGGAGVAAICGGVLGGLGISGPLLLFRGWDVGFFSSGGLVNQFNLMASLGIVLTTASLLGLYLFVAGSRLGALGAICAGLSCGALLILLVDEVLGYPLAETYLLLEKPPPFVEGLFFASYWGRQLGLLSLGVACLWADLAGRWRFLPLAICLLEVPVFAEALLPLSKLFLAGDADEAAGALLLFGLPGWRSGLVGSVGWVVMGCVLLGFGRELRRGRAEAERREVEEANSALARRLYKEAWGDGNLSVVDELVSPHLLDHRHGSRGTREYRRAVERLRDTFPDLRLSVEDQRPEGDSVTTRCTLCGTDVGGVLWYPPTGKEAAFTGAFTDRFSEGRLVEHGGDWDTVGLLGQLGLSRSEG
jgi:predicted ester cyclase